MEKRDQRTKKKCQRVPKVYSKPSLGPCELLQKLYIWPRPKAKGNATEHDAEQDSAHGAQTQYGARSPSLFRLLREQPFCLAP
eukprot:scaffold118569_cov18-Tisochrysis_lutea.AAC.2